MITITDKKLDYVTLMPPVDFVFTPMSKREYFAAKNMAAYITYGKFIDFNDGVIAEWSVQAADALIAELNKSHWCAHCQSYHPTPRDAAHKAELKCLAP